MPPAVHLPDTGLRAWPDSLLGPWPRAGPGLLAFGAAGVELPTEPPLEEPIGLDFGANSLDLDPDWLVGVDCFIGTGCFVGTGCLAGTDGFGTTGLEEVPRFATSVIGFAGDGLATLELGVLAGLAEGCDAATWLPPAGRLGSTAPDATGRSCAAVPP